MLFKKVIPFNAFVRDKVTGFEGFVICRVEHQHGCVRYSVQPTVKEDGKLPESRTIDGPNLEILSPPDPDLRQPIERPNTFKLGVKAKDRLSGLEGVIIARIKNRYSGDRYAIQPPVNKAGEIPESVTFDEDDLEQTDPPVKQKKKEKKEDNPPAGPHDPRILVGR